MSSSRSHGTLCRPLNDAFNTECGQDAVHEPPGRLYALGYVLEPAH